MERARLDRWLIELGCAERHGPYVFLRDPTWSATERAGAEAFMREAETRAEPGRGWLCVRTGGSGGGVKFARHDEATWSAAVAGFGRHFGLQKVNTVNVLPAWHVSGVMGRFRSFATGGQTVCADWKEVERGIPPGLPPGDWVISLVPTQLQRLLTLARTVDWLRKFRLILVGGGPVWPQLAEAAAGARLPLAPSYGMTETAAMIAAQTPAEFLAGDRTAGRVMPHARVTVGGDDRIAVESESLFRGYFPHDRSPGPYVTEDLGHLTAEGRLTVLGRADATIISGGKKVFPMEIEAHLRASGEFVDVAVIGVPDAEWGQRVIACYPAGQSEPDAAKACADLAPHQRPKQFVAVPDWPRNAQGKLERQALLAHLRAALRT